MQTQWGRCSTPRAARSSWPGRIQGCTGEKTRETAKDSDIDLQIVKLPEAKKGFVLLPRRWGVERSFGWLVRFRRLARDYERIARAMASH